MFIPEIHSIERFYFLKIRRGKKKYFSNKIVLSLTIK